MQPALTAIRQDPAQAGHLLVSKLLGTMDGGQAMTEMLTTNL
jgi:DNA-binding LacI/PurR family transcriptional regulator